MFRKTIAVAAISFMVYSAMQPDPGIAIASPDSPGGFAQVKMPDGAADGTVLILAPQNCPSDAAQRAQTMVARLNAAGIPNRLSSNVSVSWGQMSPAEKTMLEHTDIVLRGAIPAVMVNGFGKANPSVEEVIAEYRRTN